MSDRFLGLLLILLGSFLVFSVFGLFVVRLVIAVFGLYLVYHGLQMRNDQQVLFYVHRFTGRFDKF